MASGTVCRRASSTASAARKWPAPTEADSTRMRGGMARVLDCRRASRCKPDVDTSGLRLDARPICGVVERGNRHAVVAGHVEALAAVGDGADQDGFPGTVVIARIAARRLAMVVVVQGNQVEDAGGEATDFAAVL